VGKISFLFVLEEQNRSPYANICKTVQPNPALTHCPIYSGMHIRTTQLIGT